MSECLGFELERMLRKDKRCFETMKHWGMNGATTFMLDGDVITKIIMAIDSDEYINLPFRTCHFQLNYSGEYSNSAAILSCFQEAEDSITSFCSIRSRRNVWLPFHYGVTWVKPDDEMNFIPSDNYLRLGKTDDDMLRDASLIRKTVQDVIWALSQRDTKTNTESVPLRKRRGRFNQSGWNYRIVSLGHMTDQRLGEGNHSSTHASPRWHLRRGHYRTLKSGARIFVRQCEVGDASRGGIIKDYAVNRP